jgi:hypothetical protein
MKLTECLMIVKLQSIKRISKKQTEFLTVHGIKQCDSVSPIVIVIMHHLVPKPDLFDIMFLEQTSQDPKWIIWVENH